MIRGAHFSLLLGLVFAEPGCGASAWLPEEGCAGNEPCGSPTAGSAGEGLVFVPTGPEAGGAGGAPGATMTGGEPTGSLNSRVIFEGPRFLPSRSVEFKDVTEDYYTGASIVGDLDRDGHNDIVLVDSRHRDETTLELGIAGAAYVFYGRSQFPEALSDLDADLVLFGASGVAPKLGDIDGDGYDDAALYFNCDCDSFGTKEFCACDEYTGVFVLYGRSARYAGQHTPAQVGALLWSGAADVDQSRGAVFSKAISAAGDVNGDGLADLIVNLQEGHAFKATLLLGRKDRSSSPLLDAAAAAFVQVELGDAIGLGDLDGDSFDDVGYGSALFYGSKTRFVGELEARSGDARLDQQLRYAGDLDSDGVAELGFVRHDPVFQGLDTLDFIYGTGQRLSGAVELPQSDFAFDTLAPRFHDPRLADLNGDGVPDLLVVEEGSSWMRVYALPGSAKRWDDYFMLTDTHVIAHDQDRAARLTANVSSGDVDGDGFDDVLLRWRPRSQPDGTDGAVLLFGAPFED